VAGYNSDGFCPDKPDPFGVSVDVFLGAEVELEAWWELDGKRETLFEVDLFVDDDLYHFPLICLSWGEGQEGTCGMELTPEDQLWYEVEVARGIDADGFAAQNVSQIMADDRDYALECDDAANPKWPVILEDYYKPSKIVQLGHAPDPVPVMKSMMGCANDKISECNADSWRIEEGDANDVTSLYNGKFPET
jgi:hypothetical protein